MNIILTGDSFGQLKSKLEAEGHKVYVAGPNGPNFTVRLEMMSITNAQAIVHQSRHFFGQLADVVIHNGRLSTGNFNHVVYANVNAQHALNEAFITAMSNVGDGQPTAVRKNDKEPRAKEDAESGEPIAKPAEKPRPLTIITVQGPDQEPSAALRVSACGQVGLISALEARALEEDLPLRALLVSTGEEAIEALV